MVKKAVKLKLEIEQEDGTFKPRTFTQSKVSSRVMYNIMDFYDKAEKNELSTMEAIDAMIDIVVNTFRDPAVTFDSILDGLEAKDLAPTLQQVLQEINELGEDSTKKVDPNFEPPNWEEQKQNMDSIALELMTELHWSIEDFENADYYTMLRVFNQKADKEAKRQEPEDFFRSVMNPQQIKELEQRKLEVTSN